MIKGITRSLCECQGKQLLPHKTKSVLSLQNKLPSRRWSFTGRGDILGAGQERKVVRQGFVLDSTHFLRQNMVSQSDNIWQKYELGTFFFFLLFYFSHSKLHLRPIPPCAVSQLYSRFQDEARAPPTDILGERQALSIFTRDFSPEFGPACQKLFVHTKS